MVCTKSPRQLTDKNGVLASRGCSVCLMTPPPTREVRAGFSQVTQKHGKGRTHSVILQWMKTFQPASPTSVGREVLFNVVEAFRLYNPTSAVT